MKMFRYHDKFVNMDNVLMVEFEESTSELATNPGIWMKVYFTNGKEEKIEIVDNEKEKIITALAGV